ncbi:hypothetical protein ACFFRR_006735 [Megaselia abdita]
MIIIIFLVICLICVAAVGLFTLFVIGSVILYIVCSFIYYWWQHGKHFSFFIQLGVEYDRSISAFKSFFKRQQEISFATLEKYYRKFNSPIVGSYDGCINWMIRCPELIGQITNQDFDHFSNRKKLIDCSDKTLMGNTLFHLDNQKWTNMRKSMTLAFSENKLRDMFALVRNVTIDTVNHLKNTRARELNSKDFMTRYANDIIATTAFVLEINSNKDRDNEFFKTSVRITDIGKTKYFFMTRFSRLSKLCRIKLINKTQHKYYMNLVLGTMKHRMTNNITRPDMINMMMEWKANGSQNYTDVEMVAQSFQFLFTGFESVASTLTFVVQELMENPDVQTKLREEIIKVSKQLKDEPLTYEVLKTMKYTECVVLETNRKWPSQPSINRVCTKPIAIWNSFADKCIPFNKGDNIQIIAAGIQRDPKYFPNPLKFDPERFNEANKKNIAPCTYFPFGLGPRMCIGNMFAMMEIKCMIYYLFKDFKFEAHSKSVIPLQLDCNSTKIEPVGGFWVKVNPVE